MSRRLNKITVLLVGGGTGGHIYPGIALATEFEKCNYIKTMMIITQKEGDIAIVSKERIEYQTLPFTGMKWNQMWKAFWCSWFIISTRKPSLVIGLGAYVSFPVVMVAWIRRIPVCIQEQNLLPGLANRVLGRISKRIFLSFERTRNYFPSSKTMVAGNPIRPIIKLTEKEKKNQLKYLGLSLDRYTILVCGGSLGAHSINKAMVDAIDVLKSDTKENLSRVQIIHQTGEKDYGMVRDHYVKNNVLSVVQPFFFNIMVLYALCDLIVSRSGAGIVAEVTAMGKPAIVIPYPYAKGNHQKDNAQAMAENGAAFMIEDRNLTGESLAEHIMRVLDKPGMINTMGESSKRMGHEDAAVRIVRECLNLLSVPWEKGFSCSYV
ncbi:MAG: undecaprenyldiphospho-muramoylpentapeptide beta-N-acetylglucosaminyltransferase [bacterium]